MYKISQGYTVHTWSLTPITILYLCGVWLNLQITLKEATKRCRAVSQEEMSVAVRRRQEAKVLLSQEKEKEAGGSQEEGAQQDSTSFLVAPAAPSGAASQVALPTGHAAGTSDHGARCWAPGRGRWL